MTNLEKKDNKKKKNCGKDEIEIEKKIDKICQSNCRVCSSDFIGEIHELRNSGREYSEIISIIKEKHSYELSPSSLSRHFKNYREFKMVLSNEKMRETALEEASEQARHTTKIISLIDRALEQLEQRSEGGTYLFDVSEMEKLFNIRHKILAGDSSGEGDLVAMFQKMEKDFGFNSNQMVLFKSNATKQ